MPEQPGSPRADLPATEPKERPEPRSRRLILRAYELVGEIPEASRGDYLTAVNSLGADILRCGLSAAFASLQRQKDRGPRLLAHLAGLGITSGGPVAGPELPGVIRGIQDVEEYMFVTRQALLAATWLKRAAQATFRSVPPCDNA